MEPMSMPCTQTQYFTAALFFTSAKSASLRSLSFSRPPRFRSLSFNSGTDNSQDDEDFLKDEEDSSHLTVVERYSSGSVKRYIWDGKGKQTFVEEHRAQINKLHDDSHLTRLPESIKDFIFPAGFPGSVSDDYLDYMIWQFPTNVTGWICNALVTSSLLKAVGVVSFSGSAVAASAAAIRWVSKDGIGAVGRLIIGGRFGSLFDDDPKQWRMYADFIGSAGSIFDLSTPLYPSYFLPLASLGNLAKAVARGLKDPSFRVIQNHFALSGNLGDISAKEEVWEVTAQLLGLSVGILILINLKRARILAKENVLHSKVCSCIDCNREEPILSWQRFLRPRIIFGVPLDELVGNEWSPTMVKKIFQLYTKEKYVLTVYQWQSRDFKVLISFKKGATSLSALRSVWQAYYLYEYWDRSVDVLKAIKVSLLNLEGKFENFIKLLKEAGWDTHKINLIVPKEPYIEELNA